MSVESRESNTTIRWLPVEQVPPGEGRAIDAMVVILKSQILTRYQGKLALRDAHPKHHGLVTATFTVDSECPRTLRHGLFESSTPLSAHIRFSNGQPIVNHDLETDLRGMAIKIEGVPRTLLDGYEHDFVLATGKGFFGKDAVDFVDFPRAAESSLKSVWYFVRGFRLRGGLQLFRGRTQPRSPLAVEYFSQTPYRLGPHAVKYRVRPPVAPRAHGDPWYMRPGIRHLLGKLAGLLGQVWGPGAARRIPGFDALRDSLASDLERGPFVFDFLVQRWPDLSRLPVWAIEDATRTWPAPWVKVATVEVHQQTNAEIRSRDKLAESWAFTPWHAVAEHQPLGGINRARLAIYRQMAEFRRKLNEGKAVRLKA